MDNKRFLKVEDDQNLVRDVNTYAILNVNFSAYENYIRGREASRQKDKEIETLKNDVAEMKKIMKMLLDKVG